jgi:DNA-binding transcriptional LysR family regulator
MDMASLQAFVTVAELGSFTLAAEHLHLTQPAVSKRVAGLEDELRSKLFDRIGRQVSLTEAGQALLPRARSILLETEDARRVLTRLGGDVAGRLSMATSHHIGLHRLPPYLKRFTSEYPRVELDMHFMDSETACQLVEHGELELAVVTLPLKPPGTLACTLVWHDPLAFVVANDHPLAQQQTIQPRDLIQHAAILPATGTYTRALLEQALGTLTHELNVSLATNYLETIKMMVQVGLGWSVLPKAMLNIEMRAITLPEIRLHRDLGLVWHSVRTLSNGAKAMMALLKQY